MYRVIIRAEGGKSMESGRIFVMYRFMRFLSLGIRQDVLSVACGAAPTAAPRRHYFVGLYIWSKVQPSAKWVFWAFC
jgi:hypothetical protein